MKNCPDCGRERSAKETFCVGCGAKLEASEFSGDVDGQKKRKSAISPKQKKRRIAGFSLIALVLISLVGVHLYLDSKYDFSKKLSGMDQAYNSNKPSEFLGFFDRTDGVAANEEGFYAYIEEEDWVSIRDEMKLEAVRLKTEGLSNSILDSSDNKLISVLSKPVLFGLYEDVSFFVHSIEVEVELPFDGTKVVLGDETAEGKNGETVKVGDFLPGSYEWEISVPSEFKAIEEEGTTEVMGNGKNQYLFNPNIEGGIVKISSDIPEAVLWIDGKSTEKSIKETETFGPVPFDGSVEITAEAKDETGKIVKGEPLALEADTVHIEFAHVQEKVVAERTKLIEDEMKEQLLQTHEAAVSDFILEFRSSYESALNDTEFSYIAEYFQIGSEVQSDYMKEIEKHAKLDYQFYYNFDSNTITDVKVASENEFIVVTAELFYVSNDTGEYWYTKTKEYTVKFQDDRYYIHSIEQLTSEDTKM